MPKQTLALIVGLVLITFILFVIALKTSTPTPQSAEKTQVANNMTGTANQDSSTQAMSDGEEQDAKQTVLNILPNPVSISSGQKGSVNVNIDTSDNKVTGVQLEIAYDPNFISGIDVNPGGIFSNWNVLQKVNKVAEGRYTFMLGMTPSQTPFQGSSTVATISFTALNKPGESTQLGLLPTSLVTVRGVSNSVLKTASGTLVEINTP